MLAIPFIMGMGAGSGNITSNIPIPDKNFSATIVDSEDVTTKVSRITFDGKTYLAGIRGNTVVTIPFEKIDSIKVEKSEGNKKVKAIVTLKGDGTLNMTVEGKTPCYGSADFGNVRIEFKDIKILDIHGIVPKERP